MGLWPHAKFRSRPAPSHFSPHLLAYCRHPSGAHPLAHLQQRGVLDAGRCGAAVPGGVIPSRLHTTTDRPAPQRMPPRTRRTTAPVPSHRWRRSYAASPPPSLGSGSGGVVGVAITPRSIRNSANRSPVLFFFCLRRYLLSDMTLTPISAASRVWLHFDSRRKIFVCSLMFISKF